MEYLKLVIFSAFLAGLIKMIEKSLAELPQKLHDIKMENIKHGNAQELQVDNFYRQVSSDELRNVLEDWMDIIFNMDNFVKKTEDKDNTIKMLSDVALYGSEKSIKNMASFMQYSYELSKENGEFIDLDAEEIGLMGMYLAGFVVVQLKKDFTGYDINVDDLMKTKISYYKDKEKKLLELKERAIKFSNINDAGI